MHVEKCLAGCEWGECKLNTEAVRLKMVGGPEGKEGNQAGCLHDASATSPSTKPVVIVLPAACLQAERFSYASAKLVGGTSSFYLTL